MGGPIGRVPHERIPAKPEERAGGAPTLRSRRAAAAEAQAAEAADLMRALVTADPLRQRWLREHGARLLRSAAVELGRARIEGRADQSTEIVLTRAAEHERGETALW
jgi:hypothetical protein